MSTNPVIPSQPANASQVNSGPQTTNLTGAGVDTPQPNFTQMVGQTLGGQQQQLPPVPVYQPPPTPASGGIMSRLLQGALAGLSGGLRGGLEDVAAAGQRPTRGMGMAYGEQQEQQFQAQQQAQQQQAQRQAQLNFENQKSNYEMSAQAQRDRALNLQSMMSAYHLAQEMDAAPQERKDAYAKGQQELLHQYQDVEHLQPIGTFNGLPAVTQWLQQNPNTSVQQVHIPKPDGTDQIILFPTSQASVSADDANKQFKAVGSDFKIPSGTSIPADQLHNMVWQEGQKVSDFHQRERLTQMQEGAESARQQAGFAHEEKMENQKEAFETQNTAGPKIAAPLLKSYNDAFKGAGDQVTKINEARIELNGAQAGQGVAAAKIMTALVSGQGTGIRITMPELQQLMHARGIASNAQAYIDHISGISEFPQDQKQQLTGLLDDIKARVLQKQQLANDHLNQMNTALESGATRHDIDTIDQDYRQKQLDMETGKIQIPRYRTSPDGKQRAQSTDGGKTWQMVPAQ